MVWFFAEPISVPLSLYGGGGSGGFAVPYIERSTWERVPSLLDELPQPCSLCLLCLFFPDTINCLVKQLSEAFGAELLDQELQLEQPPAQGPKPGAADVPGKEAKGRKVQEESSARDASLEKTSVLVEEGEKQPSPNTCTGAVMWPACFTEPIFPSSEFMGSMGFAWVGVGDLLGCSRELRGPPGHPGGDKNNEARRQDVKVPVGGEGGTHTYEEG